MNNCDHNSGCCVYVSVFGLMQCSSSTYRIQEETWTDGQTGMAQ